MQAHLTEQGWLESLHGQPPAPDRHVHHLRPGLGRLVTFKNVYTICEYTNTTIPGLMEKSLQTV